MLTYGLEESIRRRIQRPGSGEFSHFEQMNLPDLQIIQLERHNTHICSPGKGTYNKLIKNGTEVQLSEPMSFAGIPNRSVGIVEYYFNWTKICCVCLCCGILF